MIKNKELSYLKYWAENDFYGWAMSQKLPLGGFKWVEETSQFNKDFIKGCNDVRDIGYFIESDAEYPESLHNLHNDLPFFLDRMKIDKFEKLVVNLHDKKKYVIHIRSLKQALNHGLVLEKVCRVIKSNQKV